VGAQRSVSYYGIRPGDYQLEVVARNSDGILGEPNTLLALTVEPYWWETLWFRVGGPFVGVGGLLFAILFFLRRRQRFQIERLELQQATEKERARIAADLHDEMGSNLTQIGLLCEKAGEDLAHPELAQDYLNKAVANSHMLSEQLDAVVWAVNPANDTLEGFIEYLGEYAQEFLTLANIRLRFAGPEELPLINFPSASRHQLFLSVKEALHNVVKHAAATLVTLRIRLEPGNVVVEVEDDGKGMVASQLGIGADGLGNMAKRMERLKGNCERRPGKEGRGTLIIFTIPLGSIVLK
jgi:signal transduction histidine kinase